MLGSLQGAREARKPGPRMTHALDWISVLDPLGELAEVGADAGSAGLGAGKVSPGHKDLEGTTADHGASGITLWRRERGTERRRCGEVREGVIEMKKDQGSKNRHRQ